MDAFNFSLVNEEHHFKVNYGGFGWKYCFFLQRKNPVSGDDRRIPNSHDASEADDVTSRYSRTGLVKSLRANQPVMNHMNPNNHFTPWLLLLSSCVVSAEVSEFELRQYGSRRSCHCLVYCLPILTEHKLHTLRFNFFLDVHDHYSESIAETPNYTLNNQ